MIRFHVVNIGDGRHTRKVVISTVNEQFQTAEMGWSTGLSPQQFRLIIDAVKKGRTSYFGTTKETEKGN